MYGESTNPPFFLDNTGYLFSPGSRYHFHDLFIPKFHLPLSFTKRSGKLQIIIVSTLRPLHSSLHIEPFHQRAPLFHCLPIKFHGGLLVFRKNGKIFSIPYLLLKILFYLV